MKNQQTLQAITSRQCASISQLTQMIEDFSRSLRRFSRRVVSPPGAPVPRRQRQRRKLQAAASIQLRSTRHASERHKPDNRNLTNNQTAPGARTP